ncbi:MAG: BTAD domain-containing putative transcriptional regulator [Dehalococcoidales bacterium]|nr:BTAD domain-containing putative transcriptional regulator [Dehalococcoidales bacterium]
METAIPIVSTKLHPPIIRDNVLRRPRLHDALEFVVRRRLTLVCAGAGYGKTTLLSAITYSHFPVIWYSLSPSDWDLAVFVSYLAQGIRRHQPGFGDRVLQLLSGEKGSSVNPETIAGQLVNCLSEVEGRELVIVLDDYHFVDRNQAVRKTVDYLLIHLPANSHLVIATRRAPRLSSLPRLRMIGEVNDVTEADLRFRADEVQELFSQFYGLRLSGESVNTLARQTEGWIIALQLTAQSLRSKHMQNVYDPLASLGADKRRLFEYLAEEVFKRQPANVQRFLCESSILSTLSAEGCDAVFRRTDSAAMLSHIEQNNLFAVEVEEGHWRYHHLFRDFLRQLIARDVGQVNDLHRRAAIYFEERGDHIQAIQHYLVGADYRSAATLISKVGHSLLRASRFDTLTFWISQIPEQDLRGAPDLVFLQAQVFELQGHYDRSLEWLERAAQAFVENKNDLGLSKVLRSKAYMAAWRLGRHAEAQTLYREALDHLSPENTIERADLLSCIALSHLPAANPKAAREAFEQALQIYEEAGDKEGTVATLINPGTWIYWLRGEFSAGLVSLSRALALAEEIGSKHMLAECLGGLSVTLRYLERCEEAKEYAEKAVALGREIGAVQLEAHNLTFLALACHGGRTPDLNAARRYAEESARLAEKEGNERIRISALSTEVMVLRRLDDLVEAVSIGNLLLDIAERSTDQWLIAASEMNVGAALIDQDDARAEALLFQARERFERHEDKWNLACVNFWIAVLRLRSKPRQALEYFQVSLDLARANNYGFWFLEEHRHAVPLLVLAIGSHVYPEYCAHLLERIGLDAIDDLNALLNHEVADVRQIAAEQVRNLTGDAPGPDSVAVPSDQRYLTATAGKAAPKTLPGRELAPLRICCFGNFKVYHGDRLVQEGAWRLKKVKSLLKYLAACPDHTVTKDEVLEVFWGDLKPEAARADLRRTLHLLRRVFEPRAEACSSRYVASEHGMLGLRPEMIERIDVDEFVRHISAAQKAEWLGDPSRAEQEYEAARTLYVGDFLSDDPYEDWTMARRERFRNLYLSALEKMAKWRMDARDYEAAITYLQKILDQDSAREDAHILLMQCLARIGRRREALAQYATCRRILKQELDLEPTPETQALYVRLVAGQTI